MLIEWHVGEVIRKLRQHHRLTISDLARDSGVSVSSIQANQAGRKFKTTTLEKLADTFDTTINELFRQVPPTMHIPDREVFTPRPEKDIKAG